MTKKKKIIFFQKPKLLPFFYNYEIYSRKSILLGESFDFNTLPEDLFGATDYRYADHLGSCLDEKIMSKLFNHQGIDFLKEWGGDNYVKHFIPSALNNEVLKIMSCIEYSKKACEINRIDKEVYIWPGNCSYKLFNILGKLGSIPKKIKLHPLAAIYLKLYSFFRFAYFFFKSIFYVEITLIRASKSKLADDFSCDSILHFDDGLCEQNQPFRENKILRLFYSMPLLVNEMNARQNWEIDALNDGYKVLRLDKIVNTISRKEYLKQFYKIHSSFRNGIISLIVRNPEIAKDCFEALRTRVLWDIYYFNNSTKKIFKTMVSEQLTSSMVHKKNGTKTTFIYFSNTESEVKNRIKPDKASCNDYSHMIVDYVVSSKLSNDFIKTLECSVGEYIDNGPIFRDICIEAENNKSNLLNQLQISEDKRLVSFLDHSIGHIGVLSSEAYRSFLKYILRIADKNPDINFLYKSKKDVNHLNKLAGFDVIKIINQIRSKKNCLYLNDYNFNSLETIGISDLIISAPISSVLYESLSAGKRTISFDPMSQYADFDVPSQKFPFFSARSYDELDQLFHYWLFDVNDTDFREYLNKNLLRYIRTEKGLSLIDEFKVFEEEMLSK